MSKNYSIYYPAMTEGAKVTRKTSRAHRKMSDIQITGDLLSKMPKIWQTIDIFAWMEEYRLVKEGFPVLFPQDTDFWMRLVNARYERGDVSLLEFPLKVFTLAMPSSLEVLPGVPMPAFLIGRYRSPTERNDNLLGFVKATGTNLRTAPAGIQHRDMPEGECASGITLVFREPTPDNKDIPPGLNVLNIDDDTLSDLLDPTLSAKEVNEKIGYMADRIGVFSTNDADQRATKFGLRLYAGLLVYFNATAGDSFRDGMPESAAKAMLTGFSAQLKYRHLSIGKASDISRDSVTAHVRTWHFRNLRDERFYRGAYEGKPLGSRWVFVDEAMVKGKACTI